MELSDGGDAVVVTRVGLVAHQGVGCAAAWSALREGRGTPRPVRVFDTSVFGPASGFEVDDWKAERYWRDRKVSYYTRSAQFALRASEECLEGLSAEERSALGVVVGTQYSTIHNGHRLLEEPDFMTPIKFLSRLPSSTPTNVSLSLGLHGITTSVSSSAAGLEALAYAHDLIASGQSPALLAGGAEELSADVYAGCRRAGVLCECAGEALECRPFGAHSRGLVPGEGSAMLLLESAAHARRAGRTPLARLAGLGNAYAPGRGPGHSVGDASGAAVRAVQAALGEAGLAAAEIDAVFVGASGHPHADRVSREMVERVFGSQAPPAVALKAWLGEAFGAFGALAAAAAALSLSEGRAPGGLALRRGAVLVHDFGFEGSHAALVLRHVALGDAIQRGA